MPRQRLAFQSVDAFKRIHACGRTEAREFAARTHVQQTAVCSQFHQNFNCQISIQRNGWWSANSTVHHRGPSAKRLRIAKKQRGFETAQDRNRLDWDGSTENVQTKKKEKERREEQTDNSHTPFLKHRWQTASATLSRTTAAYGAA